MLFFLKDLTSLAKMVNSFSSFNYLKLIENKNEGQSTSKIVSTLVFNICHIKYKTN